MRVLAPEHVAVLKSYWESNVVQSAPVQLGGARTALSSEAVQKNRGQGGWTRIAAAAERGEEARPRLKRPPRARSVGAPNTDAREVERLAHLVEQIQSTHG